MLLPGKFRLILCATTALLLSVQPALADDPLPTLIHTGSYDPQSDKLLGPIEAGLTGAGLFMAGGIIKDHFVHIDQIVETQLSNPSIHSFFQDAKVKAQISQEISAHVNNVIFKDGMDNPSSIHAVKYISNQILKRIIGTIMQSQGIPLDRQTKWEAALKQPIDDCIAKTRSFFEAQHCVDTFTPDAIKNIELGVVYEVANKTLKGLVPNSSQAVLAQVAPQYRNCLLRINNKTNSGFTNCVNQLITKAGDLAIPGVMDSNPTVQSAIVNPADRAAVANTIVKQFNACIANNEARGIKDGNGLVQTTNCQSIAGNEGIYLVSLALFKQNIISNLGEANIEPSYSAGKKFLDSCWQNGQQNNAALNQCLRNSVATFSTVIASQLLDKQIPAGLAKANPALKQSIVSTLGSCLRAQLPANIMPSATPSNGSGSGTDAMTQAIGHCTGSTVREAAMKVAEFSVETTIKGNVTPAQDASIISELVDKEFSNCLGKLPTTAKLNACVVSLKKDGAKTIAASVFPDQYDKFVNANGGAATLGLTDANKTTIIAGVQTKLDACLDKNISTKNVGTSDNALNACFKAAIENFALQLGNADFNKAAGPYFVGKDADLQTFRQTFQNSFAACLDQKKGNAFTISDYVANVTVCSNTLVTSLTGKIGNYALDAQIESHLPADTAANIQIRKDLERQLAVSFQSCLATVKGNDQNARNACTDNLQKQGTYAVAVQSGRNETLATLNAPKPLKEEIALDATLKTCIDKSAGGPTLGDSLNNCTKDFSVSLARQLGTTELNNTLSSTLGNTAFQQHKDEIAKDLATYNSCLDTVHQTPMDDGFLTRVNACASTLEASAVNIIDGQSRQWMATKDETADAAALKDQVSQMIPCLSGIMPKTTYDEDSLAQVNPNGILQGLSQTIGQFIDYDVGQAAGDIKVVMNGLISDFSKVSSAQAKQDLINNMSQTGMIDQLIKAVIKSNVRDAFQAVPNSEVPSKIESALLDKKNFDTIFDAQTIASLRQTVTNSILIPVVVNGKSMDSTEVTASQNALKKQIAGILLQSPHFGDALLVGAVQNQINSQNIAVKFFAGLLYGKSAMDWTKVRLTPEGKAADDFIRQNIMVPAFNGQATPTAQSKTIEQQASDLVKKAIEDYKNASKDSQS